MQPYFMYCLSLNNEDYNKIKSLNYIPVGVGDKNFELSWLRDNTGENISEKNNYYGEYTFHYWFWKNKLKSISSNTWFGFCAYRRFWTNSLNKTEIKSKKDFLQSIPKEWDDYDVILGQNIYMDRWTMMKILKHGFKSFVLNPKYFLKKNRNLKLHFDSFHGFGNLEKAIELLNDDDKEDFRSFMNNQNFFNRGNMFISKNKKLINKFYETVFPWLEKCEKIFGFYKGNYGSTRIYAFLMERFISYWFNKYSKVKIWPIAFYNINKETLL
jgi:hypothetical protein